MRTVLVGIYVHPLMPILRKKYPWPVTIQHDNKTSLRPVGNTTSQGPLLIDWFDGGMAVIQPYSVWVGPGAQNPLTFSWLQIATRYPPALPLAL